MPYPVIKFGTDGWRAVIADDYTFANVRIAAEAIAAYVHAKEDPAKGLAIGFDTRFGSTGFCPRLCRGGGFDRNLRATGRRHHAHTGAQLRGARTQDGGRHHDHLLAQSGAMERREVQGMVRRIGQAIDHR